MEQAWTATGSTRRIEGRNREKGDKKKRSEHKWWSCYICMAKKPQREGGAEAWTEKGTARETRPAWRAAGGGGGAGGFGAVGWGARVGSDGREGETAGAGPAQAEAPNRPHHRISCPECVDPRGLTGGPLRYNTDSLFFKTFFVCFSWSSASVFWSFWCTSKYFTLCLFAI